MLSIVSAPERIDWIIENKHEIHCQWLSENLGFGTMHIRMHLPHLHPVFAKKKNYCFR